jgi:Prokaryotic membrane lipoprotein lipid attachment site
VISSSGTVLACRNLFPVECHVPLSPRRRILLITGAVALLAGCSGKEAERKRAADRLRRQAARQSAALLGRYDATLTAHPALADRLTPLHANVARHLKAFGGKRASTGEPTVPQDEPGALTALADAERRTADARTRALGDAPPELARLLASVAAAGGVHAYLITEGA